MRPLIGIVPLYDLEKKNNWMLTAYEQGVFEAGGLPVMLALEPDDDYLEILSHLDGLLVTGGQDIDPALYGEENTACGPLCPALDQLEEKLIPKAIAMDLPVFGICRGHQVITALGGGRLAQDVPGHRMEEPYNRTHHTVALKGNLADLLGKESTETNSCHHQAVIELGPQYEAEAFSEEGYIEALRHTDKTFVQSVQWHPEMNPDNPDSGLLFAAFVKAAENFAAKK